jgi:N-acetylmuramic acid 6-phosphate etherase
MARTAIFEYIELMVDVQINNEKLRRRACGIICEATGMSEDKAEELLRVAGGSVKVAVVMGKAEVSAEEASKLLNASDGNVRRALDATHSTRPT